jgi:uncharacterized membrane protein YcjF (UPF0283 family)
VRLVLLSSGLVFMAALGTWSVMGIVSQYQQGNPWRAAALATAALLLLLLSLRLIFLNWRAMDPMAVRPIAPADAIDQTGNWGVGGPSMREPGSTGAWSTREVDRRYEEGND